MKRDMDLVRAILLEIEESPGRINSSDIIKTRDDPEIDKMIAHIHLIKDAGYIDYGTSWPLNRRHFALDIKLTWDGYEFLDTLRDPERFAQAKSVAAQVGGVGLKAMVEIGKSIAKGELQKLGIPIA